MATDYFVANTKLGKVRIFFLAHNEIKLDTHPDSGNGPNNSPLVIRGVPYRVSQHCRFNEAKQEFEATTYGRDGNTVQFVSDPDIDSDYFRFKSMYAVRLDRATSADDKPSDAAKSLLFDALKSAVAQWWHEKKQDIYPEMARRKQAMLVSRVKAAQTRMANLADQLREAEAELMEAARVAGISPYTTFE